MLSLLFATGGFLLVLTVAAWVLTVRFFLAREAEWRAREEKWRERERHIIDDAAKARHVSVPRVEQERVVKILDAEANPQRNEIDETMYLDNVKEDFEQRRPEAAHMSLFDVQMLWPQEWAEVKRNYDEQHKPMVIR